MMNRTSRTLPPQVSAMGRLFLYVALWYILTHSVLNVRIVCMYVYHKNFLLRHRGLQPAIYIGSPLIIKIFRSKSVRFSVLNRLSYIVIYLYYGVPPFLELRNS